jgi:hypothetical protein
MLRLCMLFGLWLVALHTNAQLRPLGSWKVFMPYGSSQAIAVAGDKLFSAAEKSIFSYNLETGEVRTYDKHTGLSDVGIKTLACSEDGSIVGVAYNNGNLDFIYNETEIYNIPFIRNENVSGSVSINQLYFKNGNCYVSTDIGISVINLQKREISNTYIIGSTGGQVRVYATAIDNNMIYAATQEGVKHAPLNSPNLQNFSVWSLYTAADGIPAKQSRHVAAVNGNVYASIRGTATDTLYHYNGTTWSKLYYDSAHILTSMHVFGGTVFYTAWKESDPKGGVNGKIDATGTLTYEPTQNHGRPTQWLQYNGITWEADLWAGLFKVQNGDYQRIIPDGPRSTNVWDIHVVNDALYIAPGGVDDSWGFTYNVDGFFIYQYNRWVERNVYTDGNMDNFFDILNVAPVPSNDKVYFASFMSGLVEYGISQKYVITYNKSNSILEGTSGDTARSRVSAVASDKRGNVFIGNAGATRPIKAITPQGTWKQFNVPYNFALMKKMVFDDYNQLWAPLRGGSNGVLVWSYGNDLDDVSDDKVRLLKSGRGNGNLPDDNAYCAVMDKEGNMWVGTNQGIGIYYCASNIFSSNGCDADQIKVERDGFIGFLFGNEAVRAIAVDAANRKWIGTTNGVWLISADGKEELLRFNTDNSPMPSNQVTSIAVDDATGEVYIGTIGGMVSYQGDALGACQNCDDALVYPNPVKPDYEGPIAIKGLAENAYVKITDVTGTLIYQGRANGTQMIWDGKGYKGERAKSGIYLVFSSTDLGKERAIARIVIAN